MEQFCDCQIKCVEDTEETWTCTSQMDSGFIYVCPFFITDIRPVKLFRGLVKDLPMKVDGLPCLDYKPVEVND